LWERNEVKVETNSNKGGLASSFTVVFSDKVQGFTKSRSFKKRRRKKSQKMRVRSVGNVGGDMKRDQIYDRREK